MASETIRLRPEPSALPWTIAVAMPRAAAFRALRVSDAVSKHSRPPSTTKIT